MPTEVLLDHDVHVAYGQIYVQSRNFTLNGEMHESFRGQANGLCGAVVPGTLFLMTGTHTGRVGFAVELHDHEPPLEDEAEDVVEASFATDGEGVILLEWGAHWYDLAIPAGLYRVRYSARGMDEGRDGGRVDDDERPNDYYLLQFWPAPPATDRIVRTRPSRRSSPRCRPIPCRRRWRRCGMP